MFIAGLDGGSVSVKLAVLDSRGVLVHSRYERHRGRPLPLAADLLDEAAQIFPGLALACTGSTGALAARALGAPLVSELSAFALSTARLHPDMEAVIEMGGEDSKLVLLAPGGDGRVADFALNSVCAAGTGSFLDQQAERMRLSVEEFAALALQSAAPPHVAGRCSVFAKSDMIHLQQIGAPLADIVAGLCFAVARNFKGAILRGRRLPGRVAFMGGVALNRGVVRAFTEVLGLPGLTVPERPTVMGALGAALWGRERPAELARPEPDLLRRAGTARNGGEAPRAALVQPGDRFAARHLDFDPDQLHPIGAEGTADVYMGIDVGSISTNLAVVDGSGRLLAKRYLRTASRPIEAVKEGLAGIGAEIGARVRVRGVGTTGSGRYMTADFFGADIVKNEITAQARAAAFIDPSVDTIFEIGGQDSKFVSLENGVIRDFEMNKACAAGTGSFLEEQAEKLGVAIKDEFADRALAAAAPCRLGERCTVFMENSLMAGLAAGADMDDLLAGLSYSIVENYLHRVAGGRKIGSNIFFQGGTAFNKAVVAAFEKHLGRPVTVPPNHDVTGAIGMALIARDHMAARAGRDSRFKGFDLATRAYSQESFPCLGCENRCEINKLTIAGEAGHLFYGGRCERYEKERKTAKARELPDLFAFRSRALRAAHEAREAAFAAAGRPARRGAMGLPLVFFAHDRLPFFATLLWELGFAVRLSPPTSRRIVELGVERTLADTCFPVKAALGHVRWLLEEERVPVFLPSLVDMAPPDDSFASSLSCPLTQSFPYQARVAFPGADILAPALNRRRGSRALAEALAGSLARYGVGRTEAARAMVRAEAAQKEFVQTVRERGREVLAGLDRRALVVVGRAYNAFDPGLNLDLPRKAAALGTLALPLDMLPLPDVSGDWGGMYWRSGQRMLAAARAVREHPLLYPLGIGSFSCGPDAFIHKFLDQELGGMPSLFLEIDEHSADAGVLTRLEAYLDSVDGQITASAQIERPAAGALRRPALSFAGKARRTVYLPRMADHALGLEAAFRACGVEAEVMPETDPAAVAQARPFISGKECYPFAVTSADMLRKTAEAGFAPGRSAFFMPSGTGPCRFGQYNLAQRLVLDAAGYPDVPIFAPVQSERLYSDLGMVSREFPRRSWVGVVAFDLLTKCLHERRPRAKDPAAAESAYARAVERLRAALLEKDAEAGAARVLAEAREDFAGVATNGQKPPRIGIVGEIFVRSNRFSNEDLVRRIEAAGGEAWLAPIDEWISYVNFMAARRARLGRDLRGMVRVALTARVQRAITHRLERIFDGFLTSIHDPDTAAILKNAAPWLHDSFEGEAVLSVGKSVDMARRGVAGIVSAMPFGCMPGTVVNSLLRDVAGRFGIPVVSLAFDGTDSPANRLHLAAFMEQARELAAARPGSDGLQ
ncbi:MAG: acyl-CoA dehydratase activase [Thermodesulfobacteriota bacterium]